LHIASGKDWIASIEIRMQQTFNDFKQMTHTERGNIVLAGDPFSDSIIISDDRTLFFVVGNITLDVLTYSL